MGQRVRLREERRGPTVAAEDKPLLSFGMFRPMGGADFKPDRGRETRALQRSRDTADDADVLADVDPRATHDFSTVPVYPLDIQARTPNAEHVDTPQRRALDLVHRNEGQPLEPTTRAFVEPHFGHNFANIRVHADGEAANVADRLDAKALTVGSDIVLNPAVYPPRSADDRSVLAHELAHAIQNESANGLSSSASAGLPALSTSENAAETDARRVASAIVMGGNAQVSSAPGAIIAAAPKTEETTAADVQQADAEDWTFGHSDVDFGATEKEKRGLRKGLAQQSAGAQGRELDLASEGSATLSQMSLYDTTRADGGRQVKEFERSYAVFRLPMEMTMASLGRVQDLLTAGAPQVPAEMSKATSQIFHKLSGDEKGSLQKVAYGQWGRDTDDLNVAMDNYMAVFTQLQGALLSWREAKELILIRQKKALLEKDTKKLEKLEAPAKLIVGVMEVFEHGVSVYETFKPEAAAEKEADVDLASAESEADIDVRTGSQKTVTSAGKVKELAEKGKGAIGGATGLSRESVINWALGKSDEIEGLKATIAQLKADISAAGETAEDFKIDAAERALEGVSMENRAASINVGAKRVRTRESAGTFAGVMGGDNVDAHLVTLCAEAYQELQMFADKALEVYHPVAATLPAVQKLVSKRVHQMEIQYTRQHRRAARDPEDAVAFMDNDYESLMEAAQTSRKYGTLITKEYPTWRHRAELWAAFFHKETGSRLGEYGAQRAKTE